MMATDLAQQDMTRWRSRSSRSTNRSARSRRCAGSPCRHEVDSVLLDVDMPRLHGFRAAEAIRRVKRQTSVIVQTRRLVEGVRQRAGELPFVVFEKLELVKSLELLTRLHEAGDAA